MTFRPLQQWEGYVTDIRENEFVVRLVDLTAGHEHPSREATIPMAQIGPRDRSNLVVGRMFHWAVGYEPMSDGSKKGVSQLTFRELPEVTETDMEQAREWAHKAVAILEP